MAASACRCWPSSKETDKNLTVTHALWATVAFYKLMMLVEAVGGGMPGNLVVLCDAADVLAYHFTLCALLFSA